MQDINTPGVVIVNLTPNHDKDTAFEDRADVRTLRHLAAFHKMSLETDPQIEHVATNLPAFRILCASAVEAADVVDNLALALFPADASLYYIDRDRNVSRVMPFQAPGLSKIGSIHKLLPMGTLRCVAIGMEETRCIWQTKRRITGWEVLVD